MRHRRSLGHVGGEVETTGDRTVARALAHALDVTPPEERSAGVTSRASAQPDEPDRAHVHGFHTYPARMHPVTAARLVASLSGAGDVLLDPFCGSGTVLIEGMIAGRRAVGTDLNPLAVRLARVKSQPGDVQRREQIVAAAVAVAAFADARRERRAGATRRYPADDVEAFDPHVLLELDSLRAGIAERTDVGPFVREALELVLSSILVKVSRRTSDTSAARSSRRIAAGFSARLFARKAAELAHRLTELSSLLPPSAPPATVQIEDAARLRNIPASTVDVVVTSPPYASTYDYLAHHRLRMRWLGLDPRGLAAGEMGSRRRYADLDPHVARERWVGELTAALRALSRVCRSGGRVAVLLGDTAVRAVSLRADEAVSAAALRAGFVVLAGASQRRPHFHAPSARAFLRDPPSERAIALEKR